MNNVATTALIASPNAGLFATLRTFPRPVWVLCGGAFLNKFGTFVIPFLALYMTRAGFTTTQAGLAIGAYGMGHFLASIIGGHLADTIGRRKTIILSMASVAFAMLALSQAHSFPGIFVLTALTGLTGELYRPASSALLADLIPPQQRVTGYALYRLAFNAGWAFGPATAGLLAKHSFFWLFVGDAATSLLFGLVAWFALPHVPWRDSEQIAWRAALKHIFRDRDFLRFIAAALLIALIFFQMSSTFSLHVVARGFSESVYGALISLNGLMVVFLELPLTTYIQRFNARRTMALGYAVVGLGFVLIGFATTIPMFIAAIAIFTVGEVLSMPVSIAQIANLAPPQLRGRYMGTFGFTFAIALMIGPAAGMALFGVNPILFWVIGGFLGLCATLITLSGCKAERRNS
jgi:MFS family permease